MHSNFWPLRDDCLGASERHNKHHEWQQAFHLRKPLRYYPLHSMKTRCVRQGLSLPHQTRTLDANAIRIQQKLFEQMQPLLTRALQVQQRFFKQNSGLNEAFIRGASAGWPKFAAPLRTLAQHGWFISSSNTPVAWIYPLARLFDANQKESANHRLRTHFNRQLDEIESRLATDFPRRRRILRKAFRAHRDRNYELCIPVFLAQADGIAREIIGIPKFSIYSRHEPKVERLKEFVDSIIFNDFQREILELVLFTIPLNASSGNFVVPKGYLNRHEVLHGIETDYASATNSYRAISWLQYVGHFKHEKELARHRKRGNIAAS